MVGSPSDTLKANLKQVIYTACYIWTLCSRAATHKQEEVTKGAHLEAWFSASLRSQSNKRQWLTLHAA